MKLTKKIIQIIKKDPKKYANEITINDLVILLKKSSNTYYNSENPIIDDKTYDILKNVLFLRDPTNIILQEIGAPIKGNKNKIILPFPMGSLIKIKSDSKELDKWTNEYIGPYIVSDKLDGVSAQIYKNNNGKISMYSRGNGIIGQDISHLLDIINISNDIKNNIPIGGSIRGELIISKNDFKGILNKENIRNTVAGLVNSKTIDRNISNVTKFIAYSILNPRYKQSDQMILMKKWGFDVVNFKTFLKLNTDLLSQYLQNRKLNTDYEIDGLVCVDDSQIYIHTGGFPLYSFAYKIILLEQMTTAEVVKVLWEPSMDGYLKPSIEIKPVKLIGTTITYATAHNAKFIFDNIIGPGTIITLIRSGDVIPYIMNVKKIATSGKPQMPSIPFKWNDTHVDIIASEIIGDTKDKIDTQILVHFFKTLEIKFISEGILSKLVKNGFNTVKKILNADKTILININGIGDKIINKIYDEIDKQLKNTDLATLMDASRKFGRGIGKKKLKEITNLYPNIMTVNWDNTVFKNNILNVSGFSENLTNKFINNFSNFKIFFDEINKLYDISHLTQLLFPPKTNIIKKLDNQIIVFTGFRNPQYENFILLNGGKISSSVSRNTTMLIYADNSDLNTSKFKNALNLNIKLINKTDFFNQFIK